MKIPKLRWWIAGLLAAATGLSYMDRQTLPVVVSEVQKTIPLTNEQFGQLSFLFLLAYGTMYLVGGKLIDLLGTRRGYTLMIMWWSAANFLQGTVHTVLGLGVFRFMLGLGEGGGFPASAKAVAEWFPLRERSLAVGIFNTGSALGAVIAPPLIAWIVGVSDWRWVFYITGSFGFIWAVAWIMVYQPPARNRLLAAAERDYIRAGQPGVAAEEAGEGQPATKWIDLLKFRQIWGLIAAKFLTDSAWYFFIFWLPKYLSDVRGLNIKQIGYYAWIPWVLAGLGSFGAGWFSSALLKRGVSLDTARKLVLGLSMAFMPLALLITASPLQFAIIFFSLAYLGHQAWSTVVQTLPTDLFSPRLVGSVAGLLGAAGAFGGMLFNLLVGSLITHHGYGPAFVIVGLLHPCSFILLLLVLRRIERLA